MEAMNSENRRMPPTLPIHYELGDWVRMYSPITDNYSPDMYIIGMWSDAVYLEIDPEQGDPFECDLKDVAPVYLTKEILVNNDAYGRHDFNADEFVRIQKYKGKFLAAYGAMGQDFNHTAILRYVHELQHFYRLHGINKTIAL